MTLHPHKTRSPAYRQHKRHTPSVSSRNLATRMAICGVRFSVQLSARPAAIIQTGVGQSAGAGLPPSEAPVRGPGEGQGTRDPEQAEVRADDSCSDTDRSSDSHSSRRPRQRPAPLRNIQQNAGLTAGLPQQQRAATAADGFRSCQGGQLTAAAAAARLTAWRDGRYRQTSRVEKAGSVRLPRDQRIV